MHVIRRRGWELPERLATPEHLFFNRRAFWPRAERPRCRLRRRSPPRSASPTLPDPTANLYPAKRNEKYTLDRPVTDEKVNFNYNNFYEFGSEQDDRQGGAGAQAAAVDDQARRHGREAAGDRHRRPA